MHPKVQQTQGGSVWHTYRKQFSGIDFNVQDRRHHARIFLESMQRRNQLFPLSNGDIARRLHRYRDEPSELLDDVQRSFDQAHENASLIASKKAGKAPEAADKSDRNTTPNGALPVLAKALVSFPPTSTQYEEWLANGCPTTNWDVFLQEELYGPKNDRDAFYALQYSRKDDID